LLRCNAYFLGAALGCIGILGAWRCAGAGAAMQDSADYRLASIVKPREPGFAVLVRLNGRTALEKTFGVRDLRTNAKITAATNFRLASFTKQFTSMAVMLLAHDGKLRYDESLTEIFPEFPAYGRAITVRHLLQHTSGLPDYEELMDAEEKSRGPVWSPEHQIQDAEVLGLLEKQTAGKFAAGASWSYSNSGYIVLGLIVAKVSGMPFRDFLATRIFQPLHMDGTVVFQKANNEVANRAYGHSKRGESFIETDQSATSATLGDGGIYSNLADLAKWDDALRNHTLLSAAEMAPALVPAKLDDGTPPRWPAESGDDNLHPGQPVAYGYGWFLDPYVAPGKSPARGYPRMWHYGSTMGFRTYIERFTDQPLTVVVLCNRTDLDPEELAQGVTRVYGFPH
jgi:CubicO group peptidase (beta-lactamase class C family)